MKPGSTQAVWSNASFGSSGVGAAETTDDSAAMNWCAEPDLNVARNCSRKQRAKPGPLSSVVWTGQKLLTLVIKRGCAGSATARDHRLKKVKAQATRHSSIGMGIAILMTTAGSPGASSVLRGAGINCVGKIKVLALAVACCVVCSAGSVRSQSLPDTHIVQQVVAAVVGPRPAAAPDFRLPGEFETQRGLLVACHDLVADAPDVFAELVRAASTSLAVVAMANNPVDQAAAHEALASRGVSLDRVRFLPMPHNTMWARDYGPFVLVGPEHRVALVDTIYPDTDRADDDQVPQAIGAHLGLNVIATPLIIDGGNLLSNGEGLLVATASLLQRNIDQGWTMHEVRARLLTLFGAKQILFVEALAGEPTEHVDMFATFTSANTIVVGSFAPEVDRENSSILDNNARRLGQIATDRGPLRVVRIPMGQHDDGIWRSFTNVVFANRVLLVPIYPDRDTVTSEHALGIFRQLLPEHTIVGINAESISQSGGALHCITRHLGPIDGIPLLHVPAAAREAPVADSP